MTEKAEQPAKQTHEEAVRSAIETTSSLDIGDGRSVSITYVASEDTYVVSFWRPTPGVPDTTGTELEAAKKANVPKYSFKEHRITSLYLSKEALNTFGLLAFKALATTIPDDDALWELLPNDHEIIVRMRRARTAEPTAATAPPAKSEEI